MESGIVKLKRMLLVFMAISAFMAGSLPARAVEARRARTAAPPNRTQTLSRRAPLERTARFAVREGDYLIGPEDVLEISVWKNAALSKTVKVRPDGKISLPLIGDIKAAGLSPTQLKKVIESEVSRYQQTAIASVIVTEVNSYRVFILGEVKSPGAYQMKTRTSVLQAIALAGGFTEFASRNKMKLIRRKKDGKGDEKITIRFKDLVYTKNSDKDVILKPGDTIFVP